MEYRIERDVTGTTWMVLWEKRTSESGERLRFPLSRLHKIVHHSDGELQVILLDYRSGGNYLVSDTYTVDKEDAKKFLNVLFPKGRDDGPYR